MHYWAYLTNQDRLCECGLSDGDHVWIDVGDGDFLSSVRTLVRPRTAIHAALAMHRPRGAATARQRILP